MTMNINDVNETRICADCGCVIENDDYYTTYDGRIICEDCYESDYFTCDDCGEIYPTDDVVTVNHGDIWVCADCANRHYYRCDDCGEYFTDRYVYTDSFGIQPFCNNGYKVNRVQCNFCNCQHILHEV